MKVLLLAERDKELAEIARMKKKREGKVSEERRGGGDEKEKEDATSAADTSDMEIDEEEGEGDKAMRGVEGPGKPKVEALQEEEEEEEEPLICCELVRLGSFLSRRWVVHGLLPLTKTRRSRRHLLSYPTNGIATSLAWRYECRSSVMRYASLNRSYVFGHVITKGVVYGSADEAPVPRQGHLRAYQISRTLLSCSFIAWS